MKIAYYTAGDWNFASSRLRAWPIGEELARLGHTVTFNDREAGASADVVVVQKRFDLREMMAQWRTAGARVIWDCDDAIPNGPVEVADVVTVSTRMMQALYPMAVVVPNILDVPPDAPRKTRHADRLLYKVGCNLNGANLYHLEYVAEACRQLGLTLTVITPFHQIKKDYAFLQGHQLIDWNRETVDQQLIDCDVAACSYKIEDGEWSADWVRAKSACRGIKAWGVGLPVIATPIPDYVDNGFQHLATTVEEWVAALLALESREARERDAMRGCALVQAFRVERVAQHWLEVMTGEPITTG